MEAKRWERKKQIDRYEDQDVVGRIILKWALKRWNGVLWTGFIWLMIGTSGGLL
jgi:hypothetical protein